MIALKLTRDTKGASSNRVMVGALLVLVVLLVGFLFLPFSPFNAKEETKQDREVRLLVQRYYGYWNKGDVKGMLRLHADSYQVLDMAPANTQSLVMVYDPRHLLDNTECTTRVTTLELAETPDIPEAFRKQAEEGTWISYRVTTLVTPFDTSIEPFEIIRTWDFVIDGMPSSWRINRVE